MMELLKTGAYLVNGTEIIEDTSGSPGKTAGSGWSGCTF